MACRLYVLTVFIETCIDIGIEADLLIRFQALDDDADMANRRLPVYLSIFAFAQYVTRYAWRRSYSLKGRTVFFNLLWPLTPCICGTLYSSCSSRECNHGPIS